MAFQFFCKQRQAGYGSLGELKKVSNEATIPLHEVVVHQKLNACVHSAAVLITCRVVGSRETPCRKHLRSKLPTTETPHPLENRFPLIADQSIGDIHLLDEAHYLLRT